MSRVVWSAYKQTSIRTFVAVLVFGSLIACGTTQVNGQSADGFKSTIPETTPTTPLTGGIALTFDDAYVDDWFSHRELLESYDANATFFVTRFDRLSGDQIEQLRILQEDGHEIASHGLRHLGVERDFGSDPAAADRYLNEEALPSVNAMEREGFRPETFAYPLGERTTEYDQLLLSQFGLLRGTAYPRGGLPVSEWDEIYFGCGHRERVVYGVGIDESYGHSVAALKDGFKRAAEENEVMVLYGHQISDSDGQYRTSPARLEGLLRDARDKGLEFFTISQLQAVDLESCDAPDEDNI